MSEIDPPKAAPTKKGARGRGRGRAMELLSETDLSLDFNQQFDLQQQQLMSTGKSETNLTSSSEVSTSSSGDAIKLQEELKQVEKERDQLRQEKGVAEGELMKLKAQLEDANARADDVERERDDLASREKTLQTQISAAESVKRSKEREIQNLKDDVESATQKHRHLEEELKRSKDKVKSLSDSTNNSSSEKEKLVDELEQKLTNLQREVSTSKDFAEVQKRKLSETQQQLEEESNKVRALETQLEQLRGNSREQSTKAANLAESFAAERASLKNEIENLKQRLSLASSDSPLNKKAGGTEVTDPRLKLELDQRRTENDLLAKENKGLKTEISRLQNEINNLKNSAASSSSPSPAPESSSFGFRSVWGRKTPEINESPSTGGSENEEAPPPPPKRSNSPNPRATQGSSFFSIFNRLRDESSDSNPLSQSLLGSILLSSSATSTPPSSLAASSEAAPPAPVAPEVQIQNILSGINEAVAAISLHFNAASNEKEREEAGDDSKGYRIASLIRGKLSTSLAIVFNHEFNPFTIWGTPHIWEYIVAATSENVSVTNLAALSLTKTVKDLNRDITDNNVRFRSLIAAGLNNHSLHEWIILLAGDEKATSKHYEKSALLMNKEAVKDLSITLKVLNYFPFQLDLNFESIPREKPTAPPRASEFKCTKTLAREAGDKQPSYFCQTCGQTDEASAFCAGCALQVHQGHVLSLANYSSFTCKGSTATVATPTPAASPGVPTAPAPASPSIPAPSAGPLLSATDLL